MSAAVWASPKWATPIYQRHQWASKNDWKVSHAKSRTKNPSVRSVYDPNLSEAEIRELEMGCIQGSGILVKETARNRVFYRDAGRRIGASSEQFTKHILVYWNRDSGDVHGFPITDHELEHKWGVKL